MRFVNEPNSEPFSPMPIVVCKKAGRIDCVILTRRLCGVDTHWYGGHTIACCGTSECPACQANFQPVWKGYFVAQGMRSGNKALVMCTDGAYENIERHVKHENGLYGLHVVVMRAGKRNNSPMYIHCCGRTNEFPEYSADKLCSMVSRIFAANGGKQPDKAA